MDISGGDEVHCWGVGVMRIALFSLHDNSMSNAWDVLCLILMRGHCGPQRG